MSKEILILLFVAVKAITLLSSIGLFLMSILGNGHDREFMMACAIYLLLISSM